MTQATGTAEAARDTLLHISETERGERARRAAAGALVLRVAQLSLGGTPDEFTLRRAHAEVARLEKSAEKSILLRAVRVLEDGGAAAPLSGALVAYACELEKTRRLPEADAAIGLALALDEGSGATALHAARLARKMGDRQRALALYCAARDLDGGDGQIARFAAVGEAVVSDDGIRMLGAVIRRALRAGDAEAAAVGLEERAGLRRAAGDRRGAARDLWSAAARYTDPVDRARAAHELAGAALSLGDAGAAREALLVALAWGDAPQKDHARTRLHTLSRDLGDQVGMRRWRSFQRPSLVSLSAYRPAPAARSLAPRLLAWRESIGQRAAS
jgi:tetratricopeptide (TPR) repeat protein